MTINPRMSTIHSRIVDDSPNIQTKTPNEAHEIGTFEGKNPRQKESIAYFERISSLTGNQMQALLVRMGITMSRLSIEMNYNENYLVQTLRKSYGNKPLPWRIIAAIRGKVGEGIFDTTFAELHEGVTQHALNVTGQQLRAIINAAGSNLQMLSRKVGRSRTSMRSTIIRYWLTPLPLAFVNLIRNGMGEIDYDLMYRRVITNSAR